MDGTAEAYLNEFVTQNMDVYFKVVEEVLEKELDNGETIILVRALDRPDDGSVQAEIHHRRRKDCSKVTVLLHNMRLMAVLDWWEIIRDFI